METATEIRQQEADRVHRAARFEKLTGDRDNLRARIQKLEGQALDAAPLQRILEDAARVPHGLTTRGGRFLPGGFDVPTTLQKIASDALDECAVKEQARLAAIADCRKQLAQIENALKEFEA